jgi:hypothetical protein
MCLVSVFPQFILLYTYPIFLNIAIISFYSSRQKPICVCVCVCVFLKSAIVPNRACIRGYLLKMLQQRLLPELV